MKRIFRPDYQTICIILMIAALLLTGIHITLIATAPIGGEDASDATGQGMQLGRINHSTEPDQGSESGNNSLTLEAGMHRQGMRVGGVGSTT
ncbi:MAG: hypothetical protein V1862_01670 [Methanobacteriota archaeon]